MSVKAKKRLSSGTLCAVLDYLQEEAQQAETSEDINAILDVLRAVLTEPQTVNTVYGLPNIRAEIQGMAPSPIASPCNVSTNVPSSLVSTFYDLSCKMNQLHIEDPDTFENASKALHWLANGEVLPN